MKIARFFALIFAVLGVVLMLGTTVVCFASLDAGVKVKETPDGAIACADAFVQALDTGDLSRAAELMYGQPDLGTEGVPGDPATALLWEKFLGDLSCQADSRLYLKGADFVRDVSVTVLDTASIAEGVKTRAKTLLEQKVAQAQDMAELYDENNDFRQELIDQVMDQALSEAMQKDAKYVTHSASFKVISRDGKWWAVPDSALLAAISGGGA